MNKIMDGRLLASKIKERIKCESIKPFLAVILVGDDSASEMYVNMKEKVCKEVGIETETFVFGRGVSTFEIVNKVKELNLDEKVDGILVQLPLPDHINKMEVLETISPLKDVDGQTSINTGRILFKNSLFLPCTPSGIIKLLDEYNVEIDGKDVVIVNDSNVVGRPLAMELLNRGATVEICHDKTSNLKKHTKRADILISATGVPYLIKKDFVKKGAIVIDAGINKKGEKLVGDVDFEGVLDKVSLITPCPGGVGPMTIVCLLENTFKAAKLQLVLQ